MTGKHALMHPLRRVDPYMSFKCTSGHKSSHCHCERSNYHSKNTNARTLCQATWRGCFLVRITSSQPADITQRQTVSVQSAPTCRHYCSNLRGNFLSHLLDRRLGNSSNVGSPFMLFTLLISILLQNFRRFVQISFTVSTQLLSTTKLPSILFGGWA